VGRSERSSRKGDATVGAAAVGGAAAAIVVAAAGVSLIVVAHGAPGRARAAGEAELRAAAERLQMAIDAARAQSRMRAESLAALPVVRAAIETDHDTVGDLARADAVLAPRRGEVIELVQLAGDGRGASSLVRLPSGAPPIVVDAAREEELLAGDDGLRAVVAARVEPLYGSEGLRGIVAIATPVDLAPARAALAERMRAVRLAGVGKAPLTLVDGAGGGPPIAAPLRSGALTLEAQLPDARGGGLGVVGGALVAAGLLGFAWVVRALRRRAEEAGAPAPPQDLVTKLPSDQVGPSEAASGAEPDGAADLVTKLPRDQVGPAAPAGEAARATRTVVERISRVEAAPPAVDAEEHSPLPQLVPLPSGDAAEPAVGKDTLASRYRVLQRVGSGSAADVLLAQPYGVPGAPVVVALKVLRAEAGAPYVRRVLDAAQSARVIAHENVAAVHDFGESEDAAGFVAMDFVEGASLASIIEALRRAGERMTLRQVLVVARAIARGLGAIHDAGLIHRDLRPANILLGKKGAIKITDVGVAARRATDYGAPEQFFDKEVDARADLYALGVIVHELVTGAHLSVLHPLNLRSWPMLQPPSSLRPDAPRGLDHVIAKAVKVAPRQRYRTAGELLADLEEVLGADGGGGTGQLSDWVERAHRSAERMAR
jgi:hypothetical protein